VIKILSFNAKKRAKGWGVWKSEGKTSRLSQSGTRGAREGGKAVDKKKRPGHIPDGGGVKEEKKLRRTRKRGGQSEDQVVRAQRRLALCRSMAKGTKEVKGSEFKEDERLYL